MNIFLTNLNGAIGLAALLVLIMCLIITLDIFIYLFQHSCCCDTGINTEAKRLIIEEAQVTYIFNR